MNDPMNATEGVAKLVYRVVNDVALELGLPSSVVPRLVEALLHRLGATDEWLTVAQKAAQLAVSRDTIVRKCEQGGFLSAIDLGTKSQHCWRIKASDVGHKPERVSAERGSRKRRYQPQLVTV